MAKTDKFFDVLRIRGAKPDHIGSLKAQSAEKAIERVAAEQKLNASDRARLIARSR
jgi:hypothetical protein